VRGRGLGQTTYNKFDPFPAPFGGYKEAVFGREGRTARFATVSHARFFLSFFIKARRRLFLFLQGIVKAALISLVWHPFGLTAVAGLIWLCQARPPESTSSFRHFSSQEARFRRWLIARLKRTDGRAGANSLLAEISAGIQIKQNKTQCRELALQAVPALKLLMAMLPIINMASATFGRVQILPHFHYFLSFFRRRSPKGSAISAGSKEFPRPGAQSKHNQDPEGDEQSGRAKRRAGRLARAGACCGPVVCFFAQTHRDPRDSKCKQTAARRRKFTPTKRATIITLHRQNQKAPRDKGEDRGDCRWQGLRIMATGDGGYKRK